MEPLTNEEAKKLIYKHHGLIKNDAETGKDMCDFETAILAIQEAAAMNAPPTEAALREALVFVQSRFQLAYAEGLADVLAETENTKLGSLWDLITRCLLPASDWTDQTLAALAIPPTQPKETT
jgi:hypothetical protein